MAKNAANKPAGADRKQRRRTPLFPAGSFEEALALANAIQKHAAGQKVRRLTLFDQIGKSPESGPSRQLIINSNKYGLTKGSYTAEYIELTLEGNLASGSEVSSRDKAKARFTLAIEKVAPFKALYDSQVGNRLPAASVLEDIAREQHIPDDQVAECVEIFIVNAKFVGILRPMAGAERIIPIDQVLEELHASVPEAPGASNQPTVAHKNHSPEKREPQNLENVCFYISPIGEEASERRQHADLFLGSIVEPALEEFNLKVVRADKIGKPGMITSQIIEHILKSRLVIADLSYHNPNVFYELCLSPHHSRTARCGSCSTQVAYFGEAEAVLDDGLVAYRRVLCA